MQNSIQRGALVNLLVERLDRLPWLTLQEREQIARTLDCFDGEYSCFVNYLTLPLYDSLADLLSRSIVSTPRPPDVSVIVPVYQADPVLLERALRSLQAQVGVRLHCLISIDGRSEDRDLVVSLLDRLGEWPNQSVAEVIFSPENRGVAICRNRALRRVRTQFFTSLDADDLFHPLRCLHAILILASHQVRRVNTGYARVSLNQKKLILVNGKLSLIGHNSFLAEASLLADYGYLADLPRHEDTEYFQRLLFYKEPMIDLFPVGHYLHAEARPDYVSLSTDGRREVHEVLGHPYLCGTVIAGLTSEREQWNRQFQELYSSNAREALPSLFPPEPPVAGERRPSGRFGF